MKRMFFFLGFCVFLVLCSCSRDDELSLEEIDALAPEGINELLEKTVSKPWRGETFVPGRLGGVWNTVLSTEPKTFNLLVAERDSASMAIVSAMHDYFLDYDPIARQWKPRVVSPEIVVDEEGDTLTVIYTLRDDLYWSYYNSDRKVKVSSDDVVFWYNEITGDPAFQSSGYYQQFLTMPDGSEAHVDIEKIDSLRFAFHFPRIVAEPLLATNMDFGPRHVYEKAKQEGGVEGVLALFSVDSDPKQIPSMGKWFLTEYTAGQRLVFKRNPDYWDKDEAGVSVPYYEEEIARIIPDENTELLLFKEGETESYSLRPEDLDELINRDNPDYTVFNAEGSLRAAFWTFNQNPKFADTPKYRWFTQREFRQAMSCLLNRDRIIAQVYRGLAEPKLDFFPEPNPFYNPAITNRYTYDPARALEILEQAGFKRDESGVLRDREGSKVEFDLTIQSDSTVYSDIASIIMTELAEAGITVNIRATDFQKIVEQLFSTFEWDSVLMALSGSNIFPSQGSNVWPSSGNLHMWYPQQERPATDWEARIDYLHNEGTYTIDEEKARGYWDEYQRIILEELPLIHLVRSRSFFALQNRWDMTNVYYDNLNGAEINYIFLKP
ncbi:MAG: ABC transporter substrate-binding protein [Spirochaetaceae bacterium]|jgi:peptide/nickel transport system substrate-binding protein|nr:ABC transporter substrate-binding protein [Spirochaetaceae bacterium]